VSTTESAAADAALRGTVKFVALANLGYFGVEFAVALAIGSVALFADSVDFLEDASVNFLILVALGWSLRMRARVGMVLAGILLIPSVAALLTAITKLADPAAPAPGPLTLAGVGALAVNLGCAFALARHPHHGSSLARAAFLSARNDAIANVAIIVAGLVTAATLSGIPDLVVGLGIGALNLGAAWEVWRAARAEHLSTSEP
jgi:Co/Zn/Cd efflux system component